MAAILAGAIGLGSSAGCGSTFGSSSDVLVIGAYSAIREALHNDDGLLQAFAKEWKERTGRDLRFEESYSASGAQARAISTGFDADVAILSHEGDMDALVKAGRVASDWANQPNGGMVARTLAAIGSRPGSAKLNDFPDLARPGAKVIYADPKTSGGARWNLNAVYGSVIRNGGDDDQAATLLWAIQANVVAMDASARRSLAMFEMGAGNAILTYENELIYKNRRNRETGRGETIECAIPPRTLIIDNPGAIVETSVKRHGNREAAEAFLAFMKSPKGQAILEEYGFRPLNRPIETPGTAFAIHEIGGWKTVSDKLYGPQGLWTSYFLKREAAAETETGAGSASARKRKG